MIVVLIFSAFGIQTSWFQTWLAHRASDYLTSELGTEVSIEKVDIKIFNRVDLHGVYVEDIRKDTFIYANTIHADIADWSLKKSFIKVSTATLEDGHVHMRTYKGDSTMNFQHIVDYFASEDEDTTAADFAVDVAKFELKGIHFIMEDQNAEPIENGMDFGHLELRNLNGGFSNFKMKGDNIAISLDNLSFVEKSGLALNKLSGQLVVGSNEIGLKDLAIGINRTILKGDYLNFQIDSPDDWSDFTNKVRINAHLKNSTLFLSDLAYFVPDLWGVEGDLRINNLETSGAIYGMNVKNVDLQLLDTTRIKGNFKIPNLSDIQSAFFQEDLELFRTSIADVEQMHLERILDEEGKKALKSTLAQYAPAGVIELKNGSMIGGINSFVVDGDLYSGIGNVYLNKGIQFKWLVDQEIYKYQGPSLDDEEVGKITVEELNMGVIAGNKILNGVTGSVYVRGQGFDEKSLDLSFSGEFSKIGIYDYDYHGVKVKNGKYVRNDFSGTVTVDDDNLELVYEGKVHLKAPMHFDFTVNIDTAHIAQLTNKRKKDFYQNLASSITVDIYGTDVNEFYGDIRVENFVYSDTLVDLKMDLLTLNVARNKMYFDSTTNESISRDEIELRSPYADIDLYGKYNLEDPVHALTEQFSYVMSHIFEKERTQLSDEYYELDVKLKNVDELMKLVDEDIHIAGDTRIRSEFFRDSKSFALDLNSSEIQYAGLTFSTIKLENHFDSTKAKLEYEIDKIQVSDSLAVRDFTLDSKIKDNKFVTVTGWDGLMGTEPALFAFETSFEEDQDILTVFRPSFFYLKGHEYNIDRNSTVRYNVDKIEFNDFKISHDNQYVGVEGVVSKNPNDWLTLTVNDFDLSDLNGLGLVSGLELEGILNINGKLGNVYDVPKFAAMSSITDLTLNSYLVGDVNLNSQWNERNKSIYAEGDLRRDGKRTFSFYGDYFFSRESNNLDFDATFANTDIAFLSAFEDPELYTDIEGIVDGKFKITGEPEAPVITGKMEVLSSKVTVPMFNVSYGASGIIKMNDGEIVANHLRIHDQEYNMADCQMMIYHYDWANWNYNIMLDMDNPTMSNRFLAMDTYYKEGDYYYGKAYVSGLVNIFGYDDLTEIEVDVKTERGTKLTLPMYGSSELEEGSFIIFDETFFLPDSLKNQDISNEVNKVERFGMTLSMNFEVTKDAEVKIVFDPVLEDQIISKGEGNIEINMDDFGDMTMFGEYVIRDGTYEMRIKTVVAEDFELKNGSTVQWSGSPYDAIINIQAIFERVVSLEDIMPPETAENRKKEQVFGILNMTNTLMSPELSFNIVAPKTDDLGKKALNEVKANPDELNKQFFALLVLKRFIPKYGGAAGGGSAVAGLVETQINNVLSGVSENYDIKAGLSDVSTTLGFETQINDRTTISTSFGVLADDGGNGSSIVGDVDVEYRLNDDGTFTMNFFNETNSSSITTQGSYTQGISLHYQETFNTTKQFRLLQKFLNLFRKKENRVKFEPREKRNSKYVPVPTDSTSTN